MQFSLACIASVSNRVIAWKLERESNFLNKLARKRLLRRLNFPGFINIFSETVLDKLSPLNTAQNYGDQWVCTAFKYTF